MVIAGTDARRQWPKNNRGIWEGSPGQWVIGNMKKQSLYVAAIIAAAAITFPGVARAGTADVYRVYVSFRGLFQGTNELSGAKEIQGAFFDARDIVGLALGQPFSAPVPSNDVLAFVDSGSTNSLVVFDKAGKSNLVTVARVTSRGSVSQPGFEEFIWKINFANLGASNVIDGDVTNVVGSSTNTITGGSFQVDGTKITRKGNFQVISGINGVINADSDGNGFHLLVPSGQLTFGSPAIGKIVTTP